MVLGLCVTEWGNSCSCFFKKQIQVEKPKQVENSHFSLRWPRLTNKQKVPQLTVVTEPVLHLHFIFLCTIQLSLSIRIQSPPHQANTSCFNMKSAGEEEALVLTCQKCVPVCVSSNADGLSTSQPMALCSTCEVIVPTCWESHSL